jgi:transposase-like protein
MEDIFKLDDVARMFDISAKTLYKWIQRHKLKTGRDSDGRCRTLTLLQVKELARLQKRAQPEKIKQESHPLDQRSDLLLMEQKITDLREEIEHLSQKIENEISLRNKLQRETEKLKQAFYKLSENKDIKYKTDN